MKRKSIFYRRLWYVRRRNSARIHVIVRLSAALLALVSLSLLFSDGVLPRFRQAAEADIEKAWISALKESAAEVFSSGPEYRSIIRFDSAADGGISAISLDAPRLEALTEELLELTDRKLGLPAGKIKVSAAGPDSLLFRRGGILDFDVNISRRDRTAVDYRPEYIPVNEGQTRLVVSLFAEAGIDYRGSFLEGTARVSAEIPVGEYIIFGRLPKK